MNNTDNNSIHIFNNEITQEQITQAEQCLVDNGLDRDDAYTVLQALGYILLDAELYPDC